MPIWRRNLRHNCPSPHVHSPYEQTVLFVFGVLYTKCAINRIFQKIQNTVSLYFLFLVPTPAAVEIKMIYSQRAPQ